MSKRCLQEGDEMLKIKRAYEAPDKEDGYRILVDRLWPRGMSKEKIKIDLWEKEITPSPEIRKEFDYVPERFPDFKEKYRTELDHNSGTPGFLSLLKDKLKEGNVTLVYGAKDEVHNHAIILRDYMQTKLKQK